MKRQERIDQKRGQRSVYQYNRKRILLEENVCGICGHAVDKTLRFPDPMSATIDHIIPCSRGGTNERSNLQLAHLICNQQKKNRLIILNDKQTQQASEQRMRDFPQLVDWNNY